MLRRQSSSVSDTSSTAARKTAEKSTASNKASTISRGGSTVKNHTVLSTPLSDLLPLSTLPPLIGPATNTRLNNSHSKQSTHDGNKSKRQDDPTLVESPALLRLQLRESAQSFNQERRQLLEEIESLKRDRDGIAKELQDLESLHQETISAAASSHPPRSLLVLNSMHIQLKRAWLAQRDILAKSVAAHSALVTEVCDVRKVLDAVLHNLQHPASKQHHSGNTSNPTPSTHSEGDLQAIKSCISVLERAVKHEDASPRRPSSYTKITTSNVSSTKIIAPSEFLASSFHSCPGSPRNTHPSLLDMCCLDSSSTLPHHLNIGQIGKLQSSLWMLNARLKGLQQTINVAFFPHTLSIFRERSNSVIEQCQHQLDHVCHSLLALSVLLPTSPTPQSVQNAHLKSDPSPGDAAEDDPVKQAKLLVSSIPNLSTPTRAKLNIVIQALIKWAHTIKVSKEEECRLLREELNFHKEAYISHNAGLSGILDALESRKVEEGTAMQALIQGLSELRHANDSATPEGENDPWRDVIARAERLESLIKSRSVI